MKIILIPETASEKSSKKVVEIENVSEFLIFGKNKDLDGQVHDFHEWTGEFKYLIGNLHYFHEVLNDERRAKSGSNGMMRSKPQIMDFTKVKPQLTKEHNALDDE